MTFTFHFCFSRERVLILLMMTSNLHEAEDGYNYKTEGENENEANTVSFWRTRKTVLTKVSHLDVKNPLEPELKPHSLVGFRHKWI